jgi:hypothetical protein
MTPESSNPYTPPIAVAYMAERLSDTLEPVLGQVVWPLTLRFKFFTLSPKIIVQDATGREVLHVKQKLFKFREHIELFSDSTRTTKLGDIRADRVIDWSARYLFTDASGGAIGSIGRKGWRSIWRAHYEVFNPGDAAPDFTIKEENPIAKVLDSFFGQIPILGIATAWLFHPRYSAVPTSGPEPAMRLTKQAALLEGRFQLELLTTLPVRQQMNLILSFFMLALLERSRG